MSKFLTKTIEINQIKIALIDKYFQVNQSLSHIQSFKESGCGIIWHLSSLKKFDADLATKVHAASVFIVSAINIP